MRGGPRVRTVLWCFHDLRASDGFLRERRTTGSCNLQRANTLLSYEDFEEFLPKEEPEEAEEIQEGLEDAVLKD